MEFYFSIEYKEGRENIAADALSRKEELSCSATHVHTLEADLFTKIQATWDSYLLEAAYSRNTKHLTNLIRFSKES
jgi:hypothetical protein